MIDIKSDLINLIQNICNDKQVRICDKTNLFKDLGLDSIHFILLIIQIESKFDIELNDFSNDEFYYFSNLVDHISQRVQDNKGVSLDNNSGEKQSDKKIMSIDSHPLDLYIV